MASIVDSLRDRLEQMAPRERKLALLCAGTLAFCLSVLVARGIVSGLTELGESNDRKREALAVLAEQRAGDAAAKTPAVTVPETPTKLSKYVDRIVSEVGINSPSYPQPKETQRGVFTEHNFSLRLPKLTIVQLQQFLEKLETRSKLVVVRELRVKRNFRDKELLDVELQISTFSKPKKNKASGDEG